MEYTITAKEIAAAICPQGRTLGGVWRWLTGIPRQLRPGDTGYQVAYFRPDDAIVALRRNRKRGLSDDELRRLLDEVPDQSPSVRLSADAIDRAQRLLGVLTPEEAVRADRAKAHAAKGLTFELWGRTHLIRGDHLQTLILRPDILRYVFLAHRSECLPSDRDGWGRYAAAHVIANATPEEIKALSANKEFSYV